jgi:hypothetical protein
MYTSLFVIPTLLLLNSRVAAQCTNFTSTFGNSDTPSAFTTSNGIIVDAIQCLNTAPSPCYIPIRTYTISASRKLNISTSRADEESIYLLAAQGYSSRNYTSPEFLTRTIMLNSVDLNQDTFRKAEPGTIKSLGWLPFMLYSAGRLSGCKNASLEGVYMLAQTPYEVNATRITENGQSANGGRVLAGMWYASQRNVTVENQTADGKSGGVRVGVGSWGWSWGVVGLFIACGVGLL